MLSRMAAARETIDEWDVTTLSMDGRALAVVAYQSAHKNINYTDELLELWVGRKLTPADYDSGVFVPSRTGLSFSGFRRVWIELFLRVERGLLTLPADILERYPDIRDYTPRNRSLDD